MQTHNSYLNDALRNKKVLVTGATGFIGGRLAQRLAVEEGAIVTGTGRALDKVPFLQEAGVHLQKADLTDVKRMQELVAEQDIIFHVAAWLGQAESSDAEQAAYRINVTATETLLQSAAEAGAKRFVHVSTIGAYNPAKPANLIGPDTVPETTPIDPQQPDVYGRTKAKGEQHARKVAEQMGIDLTIARPGMVYGPRALSWTVGLLKLVQRGLPVIFGKGTGHAYPIFIDNLIDGLLLMAVHPKAVGHAFNFVDPPVDWHTFFSYYGAMSGRPTRRIPLWAARLLAWANETFHLGLPLNRERLKFYTRQAIFPTTKAEQRLGYEARVNLDDGMKQAERWLHEAGYL